MAIENNSLLDNISQFANDKSILLEGIFSQEGCDIDINMNVENSVKCNHQTNWFNSFTIDNAAYHNMVNIKLYSVNEISWLVAQSDNLDSNYLNFPCYESSTAGRAAFNMQNGIKNSDVNIKRSHVYSQWNMGGVQDEYNQEYYIKPPNICLYNSQYVYGQSTNIKICCTQQSAQGCQVSNSSLDTLRSMPSLSGSFLRSSANSLNSSNCNLCTEGCRRLMNDHMSNTCCFQKCSMSDSKHNLGYFSDKASGSYFEKFEGNITPESLAACHSDDSQYLYSKQEESFSDKSSFNCYGYISQVEQFSYGQDI